MNTRLLILASSRKYNGLCLAGKTIDEDAAQWVRPVSRRANREWPFASLRNVVGMVPAVGDLVSLPLAGHAPDAHQRENWQVSIGRWNNLGRALLPCVAALEDRRADLWGNGWHSIQGWNDRVPESIVDSGYAHSLALVRPEVLRFVLLPHGSDLGVRAEFEWASEEYSLAVTDERAERQWIGRLLGGHDGRADAYLSISLGLPFKGYCYKLVAGVIECGAIQ